MSQRQAKHSNRKSVNYSRRSKFESDLCNDRMTFDECELAILRHSVDESETNAGKRTANTPEIVEMIRIVELFLKRKKLLCYGGTAINNILPKSVQFYDKSIEIPDYDFFSPNALTDAKELADIYHSNGYSTVEAKSGVHSGTYKVYVNYIAIADITYLHPTLYSALSKESISIAGIRYAPPNYLRMGMFLELSRPDGDVSRWEKVLKRMNLLNKHYPLKSDVNCTALEIQRTIKHDATLSEKLFFLTRDALIEQGVVFFGGYAASLYSRYMKNVESRVSKHTPDFDVLSEDPSATATYVVEHLRENGIRHIKLVQHTKLGEVIPEHIELIVEGETVAFIYQTIACHNYNTIMIEGEKVNIATIDTMLSFYLAFLYANKKYYDKKRILCLSMYLFQVEQHNRLSQKGLLRRFSTKCHGTQETLETIRAKKARQYDILSKNPKSIEFETAFLKYTPGPSKKSEVSPPMSNTRKTITKTHLISEEAETSATNPLRQHKRTQKRKKPLRKRPPHMKHSDGETNMETNEIHENAIENERNSRFSGDTNDTEQTESRVKLPNYGNWLSRLRKEE